MNTAAFAHSLQTWFGGDALWAWAALSAVLVIFLLALPFGLFATFLERKVSADIQDRIGPNRLGPLGLYQLGADAIKMMAKEDFVPAGADKLLYHLAPILVVVGACGAFAALPFSRYLTGADVHIGVLYILSVTTLIAPGLLLGSWSSQNKWSLLGGLRAAAQIVSYEIPLTLSLLPVILISGTLQLGDIVQQQGWAWSREGVSYFHFWNAFHNPFTMIAVVIFFVCGLAETNRLPFDLPEAESELVSGFNTEFSGMRFGLYALGEFCDVFVMSSFVTALYFGGWQLPFLNLEGWIGSEHSFILAVLQGLIFLTKAMAVVLIVMWLRWTLPRLRVDQLMGLCWKGLLPIALFNVLGTALWMWLFQGRSMAQLIFGWVG